MSLKLALEAFERAVRKASATQLTEAQFSDAQDKLDRRLRSTQRGTPERLEVDEQVEKWEAAYALPQATAQQRKVRLVAIADVARKLDLV
jgi:hypothetical protein